MAQGGFPAQTDEPPEQDTVDGQPQLPFSPPSLPAPPSAHQKGALDICGQFCNTASFLSVPLKKEEILLVLGLSNQHVIHFCKPQRQAC